MNAIDSGGQAALGLWQVITPAAGKNLVTNPSFEIDTTGWVGTNATIVRTVGTAAFGSASGLVTATAANGKVVYTVPGVLPSPSVVSIHIRNQTKPTLQDVTFRADFGGANSVFSLAGHPELDDGKWHRLELFINSSVGTFTVSVIDTRALGTGSFFIDGLDVEQDIGPVALTYCDGDQDGCSWASTPHASASTRDGRDGRGGLITPFESLGLLVTAMKGIGWPDVDVITNDLTLTDGSRYQRSRVKETTLTLTTLIEGTGLTATMHTARRTAFGPFSPDIRKNRGPTRLRYTGSGSVRLIDAFRRKGMEWDKIEAAVEKPEIEFVTPTPTWQYEYDEQAVLATQVSLTSLGGIAQRDANGNWSNLLGTLGVTGSGVSVQALARGQDGRLYVGGVWTGGAAASNNLVVWNGTAWVNIGNTNGAVSKIVAAPNGDIVIFGSFTTVNSGALSANQIAKYTPSTGVWSTYGTGAPATLGSTGGGSSFDLDASGNPWIGGSDTVSPFPARAWFWTGAAWTAINGGLPGAGTPAAVMDIARGPDGLMYAATVGGAGGANTRGVHVWNGATWAIIGDAPSAGVNYLHWATDGYLYAAGAFTAIGGVTAAYLARWNGASWQAVGNISGTPTIRRPASGPNGLIYTSGSQWTNASGVVLPAPLGVWNGQSWAKIDIALPPGGGSPVPSANAILVDQDGTLTFGWNIAGTATVPNIVTVTNSGSADAYPRIVVPSAAAFYSLVNYTTGQRIDFNMTTLSTPLTIDLRPVGKKRIYTPYKDEGAGVLPGSNLSSWKLAPGANRVALFCSANVTAAMVWRPRTWGVD